MRLYRKNQTLPNRVQTRGLIPVLKSTIHSVRLIENKNQLPVRRRVKSTAKTIVNWIKINENSALHQSKIDLTKHLINPKETAGEIKTIIDNI